MKQLVSLLVGISISIQLSAQVPVVYLPMNGNANDASGNGINGTITNAVLTSDRTGTANSAYEFNGVSSFIMLPYNSLYNFAPGGQFTLSVWILPYDANSIAALLVKSEFNASYFASMWSYGLYLVANKGMSGYANNNFLNGTSTLSANACWHHLAVSYNNGVWVLYVDGVIEAQDLTQTKKITQSLSPIGIGRKGAASGDYFHGKIDEVRVYDVTLNYSQIKSLNTYAGSDVSICQGGSIQLSGAGPGTPSWSPVTGLSDANILNPIASPLSNTQYILTLTNGGSCLTRDTVSVMVTPVSADAGPDRQICKRELITINGSGSGPKFSWLPIKNISNNLTATPNVNPDTTIKYILTVSNGICVASDTVTIFVNPLDAQILTHDTVFCEGDTIQLSAYTTPGSFNWSPVIKMTGAGSLQPKVFPKTSLKYFISNTDGTCTMKDSVQLTLTNIVVDAGIDTALCSGDTIQLTGYSIAGANYNWSPSTGLNQTDIPDPKCFAKTYTTYNLTATKGNCVNSNQIEVKVDLKPLVDAGADQKFCYGGSVTLQGKISNASSFLWTPAEGLSDPALLFPVASVSLPTLFILQAQAGKCISRDTVRVEPNPKVVAAFSANPVISAYPAAIKFYNSSLNASNYLWDFGEKGNTSILINPNYTYENAGKYNVWLIASDQLGCKDSMSIQVLVTDDPRIYIPNVFSPDGNQLNDQFRIVFNENAFDVVFCSIFNRWGEIIFETKMPGGKWWDGSFNGKPCPEDIYFYVVKALSLSGEEYNLKGTITLLR